MVPRLSGCGRCTAAPARRTSRAPLEKDQLMTTGINVVRLQDRPDLAEAWDEYVGSTVTGTPFHMRAWSRALESCFPYRSHCCLALERGEVRGVLPLHLVRTFPLGQALISLPWAACGGVCAADDPVHQALVGHAASLARRLSVKYVEYRNQTAFGDLPVKDLYYTFRKELYDDPEKNLAAIPRKQRRMVRQGDKHGLKAVVGREDLLDAFYGVYAHSVHNLGTPVFPKAWFASLLREYGSACRILAVYREQEVVAAVMTLFFRDQALPYYGGALKSSFQYAANDFMYWHLLCYAAAQGARLFDFGRSKKDTGPFEFKRHWGFEPDPLPYQYDLVTASAMPDFSPKNSSFSLPIMIWKELPLPVTRWLGPRIIHLFP
ncbi:MAG: FemAB family PEP-CTERM system-associated protein [Nitrospira sp.]|nr:MAG: FemAB family PEP-CTERM system-associated protein [Nitrospira sp.]